MKQKEEYYKLTPSGMVAALSAVTMEKRKPRFYQCGKCGRFVKIIRSGAYMDDFGYWVQYKCKKCGVRED